MAGDLGELIRGSADRLGISPVDLGTVISYETGGTFDPWKAGPTTQYGQHRGLIQWGEPQQREYGVYAGMPDAEQMSAVERYLTKAGVKPGMGLLDVYSAVNAGRVGRYGASDANNGGAPGTVADKVNNQMAGHQAKAASLLGGMFAPSPASPGRAPMTAELADALPGATMPAMQVAAAAAPPNPVLAVADDIEAKKREAAKAEQARRQALFGGGSLAGMFA